jgi:hypothetical protein
MSPELPLFLEASTRKHIDALYVVLMHTGRYNLLPELYEVFGKEALLEFLDIFEGTTIKVPSADEFTLAVRDVDIWVRMKKAKQDQRQAVVESLASEYNVDQNYIEMCYHKVQGLMENYDIKIR